MLATDATELREEARRRGAENVMPDQNDDRSGTGSDEVLKALEELESVLRENAESERLLSKRIAEVRLARENGREWKAILGDEDDPGTVQLVSTILRRQSEASGYLRRSLVVRAARRGTEHPEHRPPVRRHAPAGVEPAAPRGPGQRGRGGERRQRLDAPPLQHGVRLAHDGGDDVSDRRQ